MKGVAALLLGLPGALIAQPAPDCSAPSKLPQQDINWCAAQEYAEADAALNARWPAARAGAREAGAEEALVTAQRLWLQYRDAACAAEAKPWEGGSMQPFILSTCLARLTWQRVDDIDYFIGAGG